MANSPGCKVANFDNKAPFEQIAATQQEFVNYTYEKAQEFADSVDKKLHRGVFARSDAFNFGFKHREKPHDALGQVTQVSGRIAAGKADVTPLFRLLKIDTVAHVLFRRQRPARQEGIVFGV